MHEVTVNLDTLLWIAAGIGTFGAAAVYLKKWLSPLFRPFKEMSEDVKELKERKLLCDQKFENDQRQLAEINEAIKIMMRSQMLIMKHVETGNCTGEVAAGRKELEDYLIDRD
jgi:hypothetical protein